MDKLSEQIQKHTPYWQDKLIEAFPLSDISLKDFSYSDYWISNTSINICDVAGSMHTDYIGKSWRWLLENGKRMVSNLELLNKNPVYYEEIIKKEPYMHFIKIDNKIYVGTDGNHRTCIAKFLFDMQGKTTLHGVMLEEYSINYEIYNLYSIIENFSHHNLLNWIVKPFKNIIERIDGAGWKRDNYQLGIKITNPKNNYSIIVTYMTEFVDIINDYNKLFHKFNGKYKNLWQ